MSGKWDDDQEVLGLRDRISSAQDQIRLIFENIDLLNVETDDLEVEMERLRQRQADINARKEGLEQDISASRHEIERHEKDILVIKIMNTGLIRHQSRGIRRWRSQILAGRWSDELATEERDGRLSIAGGALIASSSVPNMHAAAASCPTFQVERLPASVLRSSRLKDPYQTSSNSSFGETDPEDFRTPSVAVHTPYSIQSEYLHQIPLWPADLIKHSYQQQKPSSAPPTLTKSASSRLLSFGKKLFRSPRKSDTRSHY